MQSSSPCGHRVPAPLPPASQARLATGRLDDSQRLVLRPQRAHETIALACSARAAPACASTSIQDVEARTSTRANSSAFRSGCRQIKAHWRAWHSGCAPASQAVQAGSIPAVRSSAFHHTHRGSSASRAAASKPAGRGFDSLPRCQLHHLPNWQVSSTPASHADPHRRHQGMPGLSRIPASHRPAGFPIDRRLDRRSMWQRIRPRACRTRRRDSGNHSRQRVPRWPTRFCAVAKLVRQQVLILPTPGSSPGGASTSLVVPPTQEAP